MRAERRVHDERERVYADIHDDIGSRLLTMVYSAGSQGDADMARETLQDVRRIIRGAVGDHEDVHQLLDACEAEARDRCRSADVQLVWHTEQLDGFTLPSGHQYHLQRILRELITNALKHADPHRITVQVAQQGQHLKLTMTDESGQENTPPTQDGGGMAGVRRRMAEMDGDVNWSFRPGGCEVTLELPEPA